MQAGTFREDLYYRLSVFPLQWQPLRLRPGDILPIAERLLAKHARKLQQSRVRFAEDAARAMRSHPWPGNVRELDNAVQRALILQQGGVIHAADLCLDLQPGQAMSAAPQAVAADDGFSTAAPPASAEGPGDLERGVKKTEYQIIVDVLRAEGGSRKDAAERLGISPRTLRYKLAQMREAGFDLAV